MKKMLRIFGQTLALFITALLLHSCRSDEPLEEGTSASADNGALQSVEVINPQLRSFQAEVVINGTAKANQQVILYAMESGFVRSMKKDIGDKVKKGQTIALLKNPELNYLYEEKKAEMEGKKSTYDRIKEIQEKTPALTTIQAVDEAKAAYLIADAEYRAIGHRISFLRIRAPFPGVITNRYVDNGALIQQGLTEDNPQGIVQVQDMSIVRVSIPLPESDIASVKIGMGVTVTFPELPGEAYSAVISRTAGALDPTSNTMEVQIDIDNQEGKIKPGMYARVNINLESREGVLSLPLTASVIQENEFFVYVVNNGIVEKIAIRKGLSNKDYFEVLNTQLNEKSLVIIQGKGLVTVGQKVDAVLKTKE